MAQLRAKPAAAALLSHILYLLLTQSVVVPVYTYVCVCVCVVVHFDFMLVDSKKLYHQKLSYKILMLKCQHFVSFEFKIKQEADEAARCCEWDKFKNHQLEIIENGYAALLTCKVYKLFKILL